MSTRAEIREGIASIVWKQTMALLGGDSDIIEEVDTGNFMYGKVAATKIMSYLHSQGVVRKIRCPTGCAWGQFPDEEPVGMTSCHSCNSTGYVFEPLVGEIDGQY